MAITFLNRLAPDAQTRWLEALRAALPGETITAEPSPQTEIAIVANPGRGVLASLPNLAFVQSAWAGVDGLLADPALPPVPLARLVDPSLAAQMAEARTRAGNLASTGVRVRAPANYVATAADRARVDPGSSDVDDLIERAERLSASKR